MFAASARRLTAAASSSSNCAGQLAVALNPQVRAAPRGGWISSGDIYVSCQWHFFRAEILSLFVLYPEGDA
jgi:hypothetical protein